MTAMEVANMENELSELRDRVIDLNATNRALEAENAIWESRSRSAEQRAEDELVRATEMRQILTDVSNMLLEGLRKIEAKVVEARSERDEKEARRRQQETALEVGSGDSPLFIAGEEPAPITAPSEGANGRPEPSRLPTVDLIPQGKTPLPELVAQLETLTR